jgi:hypothetical protein
LLAPGSAHPQQAAGGPQDKKQPALDFSSPQKTYESYLRAILANDLKAAMACYLIPDDNASAALDVIVGMWVVAHHLNEAAEAKFGKRGWAVLNEWNGRIFRDDCTTGAVGRTLAHVKDATVKTAGDTATLSVKWDEGEPLEKPVFHYSRNEPLAQFRKVKGQWKIDLTAEAGPDELAAFFRPGGWGVMFRDLLAVERAVLKEFLADKYRSDEEAIAAFEKQLESLNDKYKPGWRAQAEKEKAARSVKCPSATYLGAGEPTITTSHHPMVAVANGGTVYVFWGAVGLKPVPASTALPQIPDQLAFGPRGETKFFRVPCVSVGRGGQWSPAGVLVECKGEVSPCFAWCAGEDVHLLLASRKNLTYYLSYRPTTKTWAKLAELPHDLGSYVAFEKVGPTVHAAFWEDESICYLRYDGKSWSKVLRLPGKHSGGVRLRLAADGQGTAHLCWLDIGKTGHRHAIVQGDKVAVEPLRFDDAPIDGHEFAVGFDSQQRLLMAYKADLPEKHKDANKVHVRYRTEKEWSAPEKIESGGDPLFGEFRIVSFGKQTLVTWQQREFYLLDGGVLGATFRRLAVTDGKTWTKPRWIAREPTLRGDGVPVSGTDLGLCVDRTGSVHMVWGGCAYCLAAQLGGKEVEK